MVSTHLADQLGAARQDAERRLRAAGSAEGARPFQAVPGAWLQGVVCPLRHCGHVSDSPTPVFVLGHRPGEILCGTCFEAANAALAGTLEDRTCDVCRRSVRRLQGLLVGVGPVLVAVGVCARCYPSVVGKVAAR